MVKKYLIIFVAFLIGLIALIIIYQKVGIIDILRQLQKLRYWQLILVFVTAVIMMVLTTIRWGLIITDMIFRDTASPRLSWKTIIKSRLGEWSVSYLAPITYLSGGWVRAYLINKEKDIPVNLGLSSVFLDIISEFIAAFIFIFIGAVYLVIEKNVVWGILMLIFAAIIFFALYLFLFLIGLDRVLAFMVKFLGLNKIRYNSKTTGQTTIGERLVYLGGQVDEYISKSGPKFYFTVFLSFIILVIWLWQTKLLINFLGFYLPLSKIFVIKTFIAVSGFFPIPANLGSFEGAHVLAFSIFGLPSQSAIALSIVNRGLDLIWVSVGIFLISHFVADFLVKIPKAIFNVKKMKSRELRQNFLDFFKKKRHTIIPFASLIPENDPSVLFTTAGMHPLIPFLLGEKHPAGNRLANVQPCLRTDDIDKVGNESHHTFFEMLGNWSLGDPEKPDGIGAGYWKNEAIKWSFEFLTSKKWLGLEKERLAISYFAGDQDAPKDEETKEIWLSLGIDEKRIKGLSKKENWWGPAGQTGPCGPDTEMFYWSSKEPAPKEFNPTDSRWVEIWNDVFMQYFKNLDEAYEPLKQKNVDTGMGLERTIAVINGLDDDYQTDLFWPIIKKTEELSGKKYEDDKKSFRIIADHLKAATFIIGDKNSIEPSNVGRGYVARRLIRRAIRYGRQIGIKDVFTFKIAEEVIKIYQDIYPELKKNKDLIINQLVKEEERFGKRLEEGEKMVDKFIKSELGKIGGKEAFDLYQSYGFPVEITIEDLKNKGVKFDEEELRRSFEDELKKHQELSRTASAGMFKGGLADAGEKSARYHTATHLLLAALRQVLGDHVYQRGSNITAERMRFDFSHPEKLTPEQIKKIEDIVNQKIKEDIPVVCQEMPLAEAKKKNMMGIFENKYGDKVKTYTIAEFSKEICGGPHANRTGELGHFKIIKEESSGAGLRRIKAILE